MEIKRDIYTVFTFFFTRPIFISSEKLFKRTLKRAIRKFFVVALPSFYISAHYYISIFNSLQQECSAVYFRIYKQLILFLLLSFLRLNLLTTFLLHLVSRRTSRVFFSVGDILKLHLKILEVVENQLRNITI